MGSHDRARPAGAPAPAGAVVRTRQRVVDDLRAHPAGTTVAELAGRLGIHPNTARFHIDRLLAAGRAERLLSSPQGPGRPALLVRAVRGSVEEGARHYRLLAEAFSAALGESPDGARIAEAAGRRLGRRLAEEATSARGAGPLAALLEVLHRLDFAPEPTGPEEIELRSCPFVDLVTPAGGPACAVHLGLMCGVLEAADAGAEITSLTPFAGPAHCVTRLRVAA